ncbi:MAG: response regulator [Planctomycetota bacterium]
MSCRRILIVESDQRVAGILAGLLSGVPAELVIARSRAEAIEVSLRCRFPLCLISHGLRDGSGLTLFSEVFRVVDDTTGVLLSQHPDLWVIQQALHAGYAAVLGKPPDTVQLSELLRRVFGVAGDLGRPGELVESGMNVAKRCGSAQQAPPTLAEIASLSAADIRDHLSTADLIGIIRSVEYPFAGKERLEYFDRDTLERVVCLVRRWSQHRLERLRAARESREDTDTGLSIRDELGWQGLAVAS